MSNAVYDTSHCDAMTNFTHQLSPAAFNTKLHAGKVKHSFLLCQALGFENQSTDSFCVLPVLLSCNHLVTGTLPASWGSNGTLTSLATLYLGGSELTGTLPYEWGNPLTFQRLSTLSLTNSTITGMLLLTLSPASHVYSTFLQYRQALLFPCT